MNPQVYEIKISLVGASPLVWRRIQIYEGASLRTLHHAICDVMGFKQYHLWLFKINNEEYGNPDYDYDFQAWHDDSKLKIKNVAKIQRSFTYLYDFGDGWEFEVEIENSLDADSNEKYPLCLAGENAAPPEDVGGIGGFAEFKKAIANKKHPRHREMRDWFAGTNFRGTFVENEFDLDYINLTIARRQKISKTLWERRLTQ
jgi:hypothetical protein